MSLATKPASPNHNTSVSEEGDDEDGLILSDVDEVEEEVAMASMTHKEAMELFKDGLAELIIVSRSHLFTHQVIMVEKAIFIAF